MRADGRSRYLSRVVTIFRMATRRLYILGDVRAQVEAAWIPFANDRRHQLLAYLGFRRDWVGREQLAHLFWGDLPDKAARRNLRKLLFKIRSLEWLTDLEVSTDRLRWSPRTDTDDFMAVVERHDWAAALERYGGPLLGSMTAIGGYAFPDWLHLERERLSDLWRTLLFYRAQTLDSQGDSRRAQDLLARLLEQDGLDEAALRAYLATAYRSGQRRLALGAYATFAQRLRDDLDLEPTVETQQLRRAILNEDETVLEGAALWPSAAPPAITPAPHQRPSLPAATSFVGRTSELDAVEKLLAQQDCRLLTVTGPGGIGKSRLCLEAARRLEGNYPDGWAFVPLDALSEPERLPAAIAEALELPLEAADEPLEQLVRHLSDRHFLLLLDNFEHLVATSKLCSTLLLACPRLTLLVTSRERLHLEEEWLLPLDGLGYPGDRDAPLELAQTSDAVRLFVERAKRVRPDFALDDTLSHVLDIYRFVGGAPLGLELAAAWVRLMPSLEIARELAGNLDFLVSDVRTADERQHSLRAAFEHSWRLLAPQEQLALRGLSVFRGGFTLEAARRVAAAPLAILMALVDKSLLRVSDTGRYNRHPLIYQFTQEKLAEHPAEEAEVWSRHGDYLAALLQRIGQDMTRSQQARALRQLSEELENAKAAVRRAVALKRFREVGEVSVVLAGYFQSKSAPREGAGLFVGLGDQLAADTPAERLARGQVLTGWAACCYALSEYQQTAALAHEALDLLRPMRRPDTTLHPLTLLGASALQLGDYRVAKRNIVWSLEIARSLDHPSLATGTGNLAVIEDILGHYPEVERFYQEALLLARERQEPEATVNGLNNFGRFLLNIGKVSRSVELFDEALALAREHEVHRIVPPILSDLAITRFELGDLEGAEAYAAEALAAAERYQQEGIHNEVVTTLGRVARVRGSYRVAEERFQEALRWSWPRQRLRTVLAILNEMAELQADVGHSAAAAALLELVRDHPSTERVDRDRALRQLEALSDHSPPPDWSAVKAGAAVLDEVIATLLEPSASRIQGW